MADFLVLILILEIDNFLAEIPIYNTLKSYYTEIKDDLMDVDSTNHIKDCNEIKLHEERYDVGGEYGAENINMPQVENNMVWYIWTVTFIFHLFMIYIYFAATFGD